MSVPTVETETRALELVDALVAALEALPDEPSLADVSEFLDRRRGPIAELSGLDLSGLAPPARRVLLERIGKVVAEDRAVSMALADARGVLARELRRVSAAHRAAAAQATTPTRPVRRLA